MSSEILFGSSIEEYDIHQKIGVGGFASVYQATCKRTGWSVAIKQISKSQILERGLNERVRQEVSIHCSLDHPSILRLYTFFEDAFHVSLVLELCMGGELQRALKGVPLPEEKCVSYLRQVVSGMLYLHARSIMHRDLTLSNLLLAADGTVRIADFGLATQLQRPDDRHTTMCGTPNYMSPEVATRSSHGLESDVWSLGVMLYTMVVGRPPFHTQAVRATLTRALMEQCEIPFHVSAECRDLITRCLKKNFRERIKLSDVPHHPFLTTASARLTGASSHRSDTGCDSGLYTMTTTTNNTTTNGSGRSNNNVTRLMTTGLEAIVESSGCGSYSEERLGGIATHRSAGEGESYCKSGSATHRSKVNEPNNHHYHHHQHRDNHRSNTHRSGDDRSGQDTCRSSCVGGSCHSDGSGNSCDGSNGGEAVAGLYRPHDPGGGVARHLTHSPPVKIKSMSRDANNPNTLGGMNTLKQKFTGLPLLHQPIKPRNFAVPFPPAGNFILPPVPPQISKDGYDYNGLADLPHVKRSTAYDRDDTSDIVDKRSRPGIEEQHRSRSCDRGPARHHERLLVKSLERYDSRERGCSDHDTPRNVSPSRRKVSTSHDSLVMRQIEYMSTSSRHSSRSREAFGEEPPRRIGREGSCFPECSTNQHISECERRKHTAKCEAVSLPLQFVQDYVNKNSFGQPSTHEAYLAVSQSTDNLLGDIPPVRYTPRPGYLIETHPQDVGLGKIQKYSNSTSEKSSSRNGLSHRNNESSGFLNNNNALSSNCGIIASQPFSTANIGISASKQAADASSGASSVAPMVTLSQQCSPLNTRRLRPTRQVTKNAVLHILEGGEVCIEFLKKKKRSSGRHQENENVMVVIDACRISQDGIRVVLYSINGGRGAPALPTCPHAVPDGGAEAFYSFETLPQQHWKKYIYASRFVDVVKAKTPKITYYSDQAKCILMENSPDADFEATFYDSGCKVLESSGVITVTEGGQRHTAARGTAPPALPPRPLHCYSHAKTIHEHCLFLERVLVDVEQKAGHNSFPLTIGRKLVTATGDVGDTAAARRGVRGAVGKAEASVGVTRSVGEDKENASHASVKSEMPRLHSAVNQIVGTYETSIATSSPCLPRAPLQPQNSNVEAHLQNHNTNVNVGTNKQQPNSNSDEGLYSRTYSGGGGDCCRQPPLYSSDDDSGRDSQFVEGLGWVRQDNEGRIRVQFLDGSSVCVDSHPSRHSHHAPAAPAVLYAPSNTAPSVSYASSADMPAAVREKLAAVKDVMARMMIAKR